MDSDGQSLVLRWNHKNAALSFTGSSLKSKLILDGLLLPFGEDIWKWESCSRKSHGPIWLSFISRKTEYSAYYSTLTRDQGWKLRRWGRPRAKKEVGWKLSTTASFFDYAFFNPYTKHTCLFSFLNEPGVRAKLITGLPGKPRLITAIVYWVWASQDTPGAKNPLTSAADARDIISIPGSGRSPGVGSSKPLQ